MQKEVRLVLATSNKGKIRELLRLFCELAPGVRWNLVSAGDLGLPDIPETGRTFVENARLKAVAGAAGTGQVCLGEDSGLEVDYLCGVPGVKSHRYSETGTDADNNLLLLKQLEGVPVKCRTARYRCAIAIASPRKIVVAGEGAVEGVIAEGLFGDNGFGYDPLFYSVELGKTMGEATAAEKDSVSHRRRAMEKVVPAFLRELARPSKVLAEEGSH